MFEKRYIGTRLTASLILLAALAVTAVAGRSYLWMQSPPPKMLG